MPETLSPPPDLPCTFRPFRGRVVAWVFATAVFVALLLLAVFLPATGGAPFGVADRIGVVLLGLPILAVLSMLARPRVEADQGGITVVNLVRRRRLEWAEIVAVNLQPGDPWVMLDLADGDVLPVMGVQAADGRRGYVQAAQLRVLVQQHTRTDRDD